MIVINHLEPADPLDPGIHDQVGRRFAPLGVNVMDMIIRRDLVPRLRHLNKMKPFQLLPDNAGFSRSRHTEIVRQFQLPVVITLCLDQLFHDLQEDPRRVPAEKGLGAVEHLIPERAECSEPILRLADIERIEKMDDGVGDAQFLRCRHLLDSVGMQVWIQEAFEIRSRPVTAENLVDDDQELMVLSVKHHVRNRSIHE